MPTTRSNERLHGAQSSAEADCLVVTIIHWNGRDLPEELRNLPPGDYALQGPEDAGVLTDDEEAGLVLALQSLRAGEGVTHEELRQRILHRVGP